ncbi:Hypothetical protein FKW44_009619 [Caligus rogercresseyi]|uniref:Uncharacterized protein n=1 Tax=Caligus rogercresseyi TaxID=217165 RepID=A0A7T8K8G5_CALRO|nr:Hypothetical protein FKW44_009619 [Caligus rogercresseyi]
MNATKSAFSSNNLRTAELQKEKKAAAASRRQEQQLREAAKDDLYEAGPGLFDCPQKVGHAPPKNDIPERQLTSCPGVHPHG